MSESLEDAKEQCKRCGGSGVYVHFHLWFGSKLAPVSCPFCNGKGTVAKAAALAAQGAK